MQTMCGSKLANFLGGLFLFRPQKRLRRELVGAAKVWKKEAPGAGDDQRSDAADDHGANCSPPRGGEAAFEFPQFVGCANEERVDGADTAAHLGWRRQLQNRP